MSLILYLSQVTCCLGIFYTLYHFVLRKETLFESNRFYLIGSLALSIVLPLIKIYIDSREQDPDLIKLPYVYVGSYVQTITTDLAVTTSSPFPWDRLILGMYSIGIAVMAIRLLTAIKEIRLIRRHGCQTRVAGHLCILSDKVKSPFSFFNTIYFPLTHTFDDRELKEIVAHEMAHVRGRHTMDVLFMEMACIFLWPSPLIYFYRKALKDVHEYVADAAVLKETHWENYAQLLVSQQHSQLQNILSNQLIYSQLKKRLLMMNQKRSGTLAGFKYLGFIPVLLVALVLFSFREKLSPQEESGALFNEAIADRVIHLTIGADQKIYFGLKEVPIEELESILRHQIAITNDTLLRVKVDKSTRVGDLAEIDLIGDRLNIWTVFDTGEPTDSTPLNSDAKDALSADTLPESSIISLRLTDPSKGDKVDLLSDGQSPAEHNPNLDYTLDFPIFPGCDEVAISERATCGMTKLGEYINKNLVYPNALKSSGIEGRVLVKFVVGADGYIKDVSIQESLHPEADKVVMDLVNGMNAKAGKWRPARKEGKSYDAEMILPISFSLDGKSADTEPLKEVDEMPRFPGCETIENLEERNACALGKMFEFVYSNINYPQEDRKNNVEGVGIVQFIVGTDGRLTDIKVVRSPSESISKELVRIMTKMAALPEQWIPARKGDKAVSYQLVLPVKFKLQDDEVKGNALTSESTKPERGGKSVVVIPNPASESITVELTEGTQSINIFDATGHLVLSQKPDGKTNDTETINVSSLPAGRYLVQLLTSEGSASGSFTIVK